MANYDEIMELIGATAKITKINSESTAIVLKQLQDQERLLGGLTRTVSSLDERFTDMENDIEQIKMNDRITTTQKNTITTLAKKRVIEIIGDDPLTVSKYFIIFIRNLYKDARRYAGLSTSIIETKKCDYQRVLDYIEAWFPGCGMAELIHRADANAEARRQARELGYIS